MYAYIHVCIYVYIHMYVYIFMCIYIYIYICICICIIHTLYIHSTTNDSNTCLPTLLRRSSPGSNTGMLPSRSGLPCEIYDQQYNNITQIVSCIIIL